MRKKVTLLILAVLLVFMMTGCNTEIALYYFPGSETSAYQLDIRFDNNELNLLNSSAKDNKNAAVHSDYYLADFASEGDNCWTVEQYLTALLKYKSDFTFMNAEVGTGTTVYIFYTTNGVLNEFDEIQTEEERDITPSIEGGLFFNYYNFEAQNPMTKLRNEYDNAVANPERGLSAIEVMQNGWHEGKTETNPEKQQELLGSGWIVSRPERNEYMRKLLPSFAEAFPIAANKAIFNPDRLKLNYYLQSNSKLNTSGELLYDASGNKYYLFKELFANSNTKIFYQMRRANSITWNFLAIALGFGAVGIVYMISKYKSSPKAPKKTNTIADFKDRLPYDPNSNSPFDGY